jgi:hypothetical protein
MRIDILRRIQSPRFFLIQHRNDITPERHTVVGAKLA